MAIERELSMPYWCVGNPVGDPFGPGVLDRIDSLAVTDILCDARKNNLISYTSAHDDDLVDWNPYHPEDDKDPKSETYKTLKMIKEKLEKEKIPIVAEDIGGNKGRTMEFDTSTGRVIIYLADKTTKVL